MYYRPSKEDDLETFNENKENARLTEKLIELRVMKSSLFTVAEIAFLIKANPYSQHNIGPQIEALYAKIKG